MDKFQLKSNEIFRDKPLDLSFLLNVENKIKMVRIIVIYVSFLGLLFHSIEHSCILQFLAIGNKKKAKE